MKVELYKKDNTGAIRYWSAEGFVDDYSGTGEIVIVHGQLNGAMQQQIEFVDGGKASRTIKEQVMSRIASRVSKRRDMGYANTIEAAKTNGGNNQLDLKRPMLAQKFKGKLPEKFFVQYKFDGNRCLIHNNGERLIAYTRAGKENPNLDHILKDVDIPVGCTLDGELYAHGVPLQTIRSWVSRKQPDTEKIKYMVYDIMDSIGYSERLSKLRKLRLGGTISIVKTTLKTALELDVGIINLLDSARGAGYEGLILRTDCDTPYEHGKRSKSLIKVKKWEDSEFLVTDIVSSADGWAVLVCLTNSGTFKVTAPGTIADKTEVLVNKQNYIGRTVTVEYANLTKDGIPFHPVAIAWREKGE